MERDAVCRREMQSRGATFVHPFENPDVIAGQGTASLELQEEVPDLDVVIAPVGGGGLLAGTAITVKRLRPEADGETESLRKQLAGHKAKLPDRLGAAWRRQADSRHGVRISRIASRSRSSSGSSWAPAGALAETSAMAVGQASEAQRTSHPTEARWIRALMAATRR